LSKISKCIQKVPANQAQVTVAARCFSDKGVIKADQQSSELAKTEGYMQFSKSPTSNFGDLPRGEIPEPLKYNRPFQITTLSNGIKVATEKTATQTATVGVYVGAGSRNDTLATTGASHVLRQLLTRGSQGYSRQQVNDEVMSLGARLHGESGREQSSLGMTVFKDDISRAVAVLGDAVSNASLDPAELEILKQEVAADHDNSHNDLQYTTLENAHFNSFRDHMLGQPIKGEAEQLGNLSVDDLRQFQAANYFGDNMVIVGSGDINHEQFVDMVNNAFQSVSKQATGVQANSEKAIYTPSMLFIRDDEMYNSNVAVFYDAPHAKHEDFYAFLLFKHMFGSYRIDKHAEHLNDVKKQYNSMHALLGDLPDVTMAESHYFPYSDCGIFGNYFFGNEVFTRQMNYCGVCLPTIYGHYLNDVEVVRGRNHLWNSLLNIESNQAINKEVGSQLLSVGRRVHRSEVAARVSHFDAYHMKHLAYQWFYDAEPSFTSWGPVESVAVNGSYKYFKINTMSTVTNAHHSLFN